MTGPAHPKVTTMKAPRHPRVLTAATCLALLVPAAAWYSTTPTTAAPTSTGSAGAAGIGSASYPVPSGAIYVATNGKDPNPGTQAAPKATVLAAVNAAPPGGTVVVRGGVYHQANIGVFKPVTVQNAPGEAVWFDGSSKVTAWTQSGSTWTAPWSTFFDHSVSFTKGQYDSQFLDARHPMAAWPDQVFVDGQQLEQVDISKGVGPGQFAVDQANKRLVIGTNPSGHEVRASDLDRLFTVGSPDVVLRGFGVRRYANALPRMGVLYLQRQRDLVENVEVDDVATLAISMGSDGSNGSGTINHVTIRRAGLGGIDGMMFDNGKVTNTLITDGNTQKFTPFPATGAIKVTRSKNVTFSKNVITDNHNTTGIWTDESTIGVTITGNRVTNSAGNGFAGIQTELTSKGVVADNVVSGTVRGIYVFDSNGMRVVDNTVWNSVIADISLDQDFRRQAHAGDTGHDPRNPVPDPNNTWISGNNTVNDNILGTDAAFSNFQLWVLDKDKAVPASQMLTTANGNAFEAKDANSPTLVGWGDKMDGSVTQFNDLSAWSRTVGRGWNNTTYAAGSSPAQAAQLVASTKGAPP